MPVAIAGTNIQSMVGGRVDLWKNSSNRIGIMNPYESAHTASKYHSKIGF